MSLLDVVEQIARILGTFILCLLLICVGIYFYNMNTSPYDDLGSFLKNITCIEDTCTVTFDSNVSNFYSLQPTGSMVPVAGGYDTIICLDSSKIKLGDIVVANDLMHQVYKIDGDWVQLKGVNNAELDAFKFPASKIDCVVAGVIR